MFQLIKTILSLSILAYVEQIYQTYVAASSKKPLHDACQKLDAMTTDPMNTMFEKQPREVAIQKQKARKSLVVNDVPLTTPSMLYNLHNSFHVESYRVVNVTISRAAGTVEDWQLTGPIFIYLDSASPTPTPLEIVFTVCKPEYMNMGPLNY